VQSVDGVSAAFDDAGERSVIAAQLFGEEGKRQVQAVTTAIDSDLAPALAGFEGQIFTDKTVENAREVNAQVAEAKASMNEIAVQLLPAVNIALAALADYFTAVGNLGQMTGEGLRGFIPQGVAAGGSRSGVSAEALARINASSTGFSSAAVTVINPPGTPAVTVDAARIYDRRNGRFGPS